VTFHSLRHLSNSVAIAEGMNPLDIARRNGQTDTRMVLDTYRYLLKAADRCNGNGLRFWRASEGRLAGDWS
jgi:integrase